MADVTLRQVRKSYGNVEIIHGIDLHIQSGEFVVFVGPVASGPGQSRDFQWHVGAEFGGAQRHGHYLGALEHVGDLQQRGDARVSIGLPTLLHDR